MLMIFWFDMTSSRFHDTNAYILPLLGPISNDFEPAVRRHFMEQLALLAKVNSVIFFSELLRNLDRIYEFI